MSRPQHEVIPHLARVASRTIKDRLPGARARVNAVFPRTIPYGERLGDTVPAHRGQLSASSVAGDVAVGAVASDIAAQVGGNVLLHILAGGICPRGNVGATRDGQQRGAEGGCLGPLPWREWDVRIRRAAYQ